MTLMLALKACHLSVKKVYRHLNDFVNEIYRTKLRKMCFFPSQSQSKRDSKLCGADVTSGEANLQVRLRMCTFFILSFVVILL